MKLLWRVAAAGLVLMLVAGGLVLREGLQPVPLNREADQPLSTTLSPAHSQRADVAQADGGGVTLPSAATATPSKASAEADSVWAEHHYQAPVQVDSPVRTEQATKPMAWPGQPVPPNPFVEPELHQDPHRGDRDWGDRRR